PGVLALATYVDGLYQTLLNRPSDAASLILWVQQLRAGLPREVLVNALWNSPEHRGLEVDNLFQTFLHRAPGAGERGAFINAMLAGADEKPVARTLLLSAEYDATHGPNATFVTGVFLDVLGRFPDPVGVTQLTQALQNGTLTRAGLVDTLLNSDEAAGKTI